MSVSENVSIKEVDGLAQTVTHDWIRLADVWKQMNDIFSWLHHVYQKLIERLHFEALDLSVNSFWLLWMFNSLWPFDTYGIIELGQHWLR